MRNTAEHIQKIRTTITGVVDIMSLPYVNDLLSPKPTIWNLI